LVLGVKGSCFPKRILRLSRDILGVVIFSSYHIGEKMHNFHDMLLGLQPTEQEAIDHIDCNYLNNRRREFEVGLKENKR